MKTPLASVLLALFLPACLQDFSDETVEDTALDGVVWPVPYNGIQRENQLGSITHWRVYTDSVALVTDDGYSAHTRFLAVSLSSKGTGEILAKGTLGVLEDDFRLISATFKGNDNKLETVDINAADRVVSEKFPDPPDRLAYAEKVGGEFMQYFWDVVKLREPAGNPDPEAVAANDKLYCQCADQKTFRFAALLVKTYNPEGAREKSILIDAAINGDPIPFCSGAAGE